MRKITAVLLTVCTAALCLAGCGKEDGLTKITLNEVAHSIFYAPQYAAIELGYFEEEALDVTLVNGLGADKTMTGQLRAVDTEGRQFSRREGSVGGIRVG